MPLYSARYKYICLYIFVRTGYAAPHEEPWTPGRTHMSWCIVFGHHCRKVLKVFCRHQRFHRGYMERIRFPASRYPVRMWRSSGNRTVFFSFSGKNPADQPQTFKPILSHQLSDTSTLPTECSTWFPMPEPESENDDDPHDRVQHAGFSILPSLTKDFSHSLQGGIL